MVLSVTTNTTGTFIAWFDVKVPDSKVVTLSSAAGSGRKGCKYGQRAYEEGGGKLHDVFPFWSEHECETGVTFGPKVDEEKKSVAC